MSSFRLSPWFIAELQRTAPKKRRAHLRSIGWVALLSVLGVLALDASVREFAGSHARADLLALEARLAPPLPHPTAARSALVLRALSAAAEPQTAIRSALGRPASRVRKQPKTTKL